MKSVERVEQEGREGCDGCDGHEGREKRVLLAFSGGIDSCAAVDILRNEGWCVELLTIDMVGDEEMVAQAGREANRLDATLHIVDGRELFKREIIDNFTSEYLAGSTPAPCTRCNPRIKWRLLAQKGDELGIYHIATGHYLRIKEHNGDLYVAQARDPRKDQSYYLWGIESAILRRAITPMGEQIKEEMRAKSAIQRESMGICFLRGRHYSEYIVDHYGELPKGDIVNQRGDVVSRHNGIARYTIGQRRGEGIPEGLRVVAIDGVRNQICVGKNEELYRTTLDIEECHFINPCEVSESSRVRVMVRGIGRNPEGFARVEIAGERARIELLDDKAWAVASGQPVVLYIDDRVVGGGIFRK